MDLSVNKNINFKGIKGAYRADNAPVFEFTIPPHAEDEKVSLGIAPLRKDPKTGLYIEPKESDIRICDFKDEESLNVLQQNLRRLSSGFAYKYIITKKDDDTDVRTYLDAFRTINMDGSDEKMNIIEQGYKYGISPKGGTMYHAFIDSNAILDKDGNLVDRVPDFHRNHFNKLGGSTKGLIHLIENTNAFNPYTYLMVNPDIGADRVSSQAYWPECQYRCQNLDDFKRINFALYKQGKGYIADGAFTSQSINSPLVQHALKWGEESPFYYMLCTDGSGEIDPGILPNKDPYNRVDVYKHIGVRLVNPKDKNYDKTRPTYIQFYDDRLLSPEKQKDSSKLMFTYDKEPDDHYDIISDDDSIRPFAFEVDPFSEKLQMVFNKGETTKLINDITKEKCGIDLDEFLTFEHFKIVPKEQAKGATFWDGNVDIFKLNTSNPGADPKYQDGCRNSRNYLLGVATYWSETIQRDLILRTAKMSDTERRKTAFANQISPKRYSEMLNTVQNATSISPILEQGKTIEQYIKEFPLQSIETDMDLGAVFSEPQFNEEFLQEPNLKYLINLVDDTIDSVIPPEYKDDQDYKTFVVKTYANDIIKNILVGAMNPSALKEDGSINLDEIGKVTIKSLTTRTPINPDDERAQVIKAIKKGLNSDSTIAIRKKIADELKYISLENFKLAESIVLQGKGGLNWRFDAAKDIGDIDAIRDGRATFDQIWNGDAMNPGVKDFWGEFIKNIRKYNPASYIINEITMLDSFYVWNDKQSMMDFDPTRAAAFEKLSPELADNYKYHPPYSLEMNYIAQSNSTAGSIFDNYFNNLSTLAGCNPEDGSNAGKAGNLEQLKSQVDGLVEHAYPNSAMFAHFFTENHDKPRLLHTLPLDMNLYVVENLQEANDFYKLLAHDITGGRTDYTDISPKAVAVGLIMRDEIEKEYKDKPEVKAALLESLQNLVNGRKTKDEPNNYKRADVFGTLPYEVSLEDVIKNAGLEDELPNVAKMHADMLSNSINTQQSLTQVSSCLVGTPTIFNGAEFCQTGYETKSKNVYVSNRNQILRDLEHNPYYQDNYAKNYAIQGLSQKKDLSALRNGTPISLSVSKKVSDVDDVYVDNNNNQPEYANKENFDYLADKISQFIIKSRNWVGFGNVRYIDPALFFNTLDRLKSSNYQEYQNMLINTLGISQDDIRLFEENYKSLKHYFTQKDNSTISFYPIFKYDEKGSQVISVITDNGLPSNKTIEADIKSWDGSVEHADLTIKVKKPKANYYVRDIEIKDEKGACPLNDGTVLKRKVYDPTNKRFVDDTEKYVVVNGCIKNQQEDNKIKVDDTAMYFYVPSYNPNAKYGQGFYGAH